MKIGIFSRIYKDKDKKVLLSILQCAKNESCELHIYEPFFQQFYDQIELSGYGLQVFNDADSLENRIDIMFSIGGDGTLLNTITVLKDSGIPVLGINTGRLGFLAGVNRNEEISVAMKALKNKEYDIDKRSLLELNTNMDLFGNSYYAINDFTLHKLDSSAMITIHAFVDGFFLNSYWADGIILSTPTGSTAYNLSCGGPIVHPNAKVFTLTPVAPHNLNVRPIVLPDDKTYSFRVDGRSDQFLCTLDSRYQHIDNSVKISVKKANFYLNLIRFQNHNYFGVLRNKLMWGQDARN